MSIAKQCELLDVSRSWYYYKPLDPNENIDQIMLKCEVKQEYILHPFYGYRRIANALSRKEIATSNKQIRALMKKMGLQAIYPKPKLSKAGKGRALDNVYVERLWRSLKYENIFLHDYRSLKELKGGIKLYFKFYNAERYHQSLNYQTPDEMYFSLAGWDLTSAADAA